MPLPIRVGQAYVDGKGNVVAIVAQHPWRPELLVGCLVTGEVKRYGVNDGVCHTFHGRYSEKHHLISHVNDKKKPTL